MGKFFRIGFSLLLILGTFGLTTVSPLVALAQTSTANDLKSKIEDKNSEIQKLEQEIQTYKTQLDEVGKNVSSLSTSVKQLDLTKNKLLTDIKVTSNKIDKANLTIQQLGLQINTKEEIIKGHKEALARGIRSLDALDNGTFVESVLAQHTLADAWREIDSMESFQEKIGEHIDTLRGVKVELETNKNQAQEVKTDLVSLKDGLADQKTIIDQNAAEKNKLLQDTKSTEANYKKILADKQALKAAFEKEVDAYESQLKFILDPNSLPSAGVLSWPLDDIYVTQQFGITNASARLYASGSHNGTDFKASMGTPVKSMGNGVIVGTGDTDITCKAASFGRWILIQYDNGLSSTYGHLSLIKVSQGQQVKAGEIVGYSGNTGYSTGPHLHVSVYASQAVSVQNRASAACSGKTYTMPIAATNGYLDPMFYLPPYTR